MPARRPLGAAVSFARASLAGLVLGLPLGVAACLPVAAAEPSLELRPHDHAVIVGNTLAERMQYFGNFETLLHARFPGHELVVRNLGWSADELMIRLRSKGFHDHGNNLADHAPDVLVAMFGFNESFAGPAGVAKFEKDLAAFLDAPWSIDGYASPGGAWDQGTSTHVPRGPEKPIRRIVLVSPLAHENRSDLRPLMEPVSIIRVALPMARPCPLAEA